MGYDDFLAERSWFLTAENKMILNGPEGWHSQSGRKI
jgi:hypothetical protein